MTPDRTQVYYLANWPPQGQPMGSIWLTHPCMVKDQIGEGNTRHLVCSFLTRLLSWPSRELWGNLWTNEESLLDLNPSYLTRRLETMALRKVFKAQIKWAMQQCLCLHNLWLILGPLFWKNILFCITERGFNVYINHLQAVLIAHCFVCKAAGDSVFAYFI